MKKKLLFVFSAILLLPTLGSAQCSDLFFSEYIEGSSSNKALEIYNPTSNTVDLSDYVVYRANNGSLTPTDSIFLRGMLEADSVFVVSNPSANAAISAQSDTTHSLTFFNGDDAVYMKKISTGDTLDIIGVVGVDPGSGWIVGAGATNNFTLVRKASVFNGQLNWAIGATEWDVFPIDMSDSLGAHYKLTCPTSVIDLVITEIMYNPAAITDSMEFIEIYNNGTTVVDMTGFSITEGITFTFPSVTIAPDSFLIVARDASAMSNVLGVSAFEWASGENLSNTTEEIVLKDDLGNTIDSVSYDDGSPWPVGPPSPDGGGPSIELTDVALDNNIAASWAISTTAVTGVIENGSQVYATPGAFPSSAMRLLSVVDSVVTCNGGADGAIAITVVNGVMPFSYLWSNSDTTSSLSGLGVGTYTITVTDASMTTVTGTYTITEPSAINIMVTVDSNVSCNGLADGGLTATATGGTGRLDYSWNVVSSPFASQSFESLTTDNWAFVESPVTYNTEGDSVVSGSDDIWAVIERFSSNIDTASNGVYFWGMQDIDNTNGGGAFYHTLTFDPIDVSAETGVKLAFDYYSIGFDSTDSLEYQIRFDNDTSWNTNGTPVNKNSQAWTTIEINVPDSAGFVRFRLQAKQNGSTDYAGFDNVRLIKSPNVATDLAAGNYTVTVTDSLGCSAVMAATITEPALLVASTVIDSNVSVNGGTDGGATASATGGTAPFTYSWSNSATTASITGVAAGTYTVTITDNNGCSDFETATITQPTVILVSTIVDSSVSCNGFFDGGASVSASGGTMPYTYAWSNSATTASITGVGTGIYTVTVTDNSGSTATSSTTITEPALLVASVVIDSNVSTNGGLDGGATASAVGGTMPYTYTWSNSATTASITGVGAGTYTVTITDNNGCIDTETAMITQPTLMTVTATTSNVSCNGGADGTIDLTVVNGTPPYTYLWSNSDTTEDLSGLAAGTYNVTVTDASMAMDISVYVISEPLPIAIVVTVDSNVSCNSFANGGLSATATGGTGILNYAWSAGNASLAGQSFESTAADNWNFIMNPATYNTEGDSIVSGSDDVWAVIEEFTGNIDTASNGLYFWGAQDLENGNGGGAFYHTLTFDPIDVSMENGVKLAFDYYTEGYDGSDSIAYEVVFDNGTSWDTSGIALNKSTLAWTTVEINVPDTANFVRLRLQAKQNGGSDYSAFDNIRLFTSSNSVTGLTAGNYDVIVTDALGCTVTSSATITEPTVLSASFVTSDASAVGAADGAIDLSVSGGTMPYSYVWSNSATTEDLTAVSAGTYSVTITDANGCAFVDSATVNDPAAVLLTISGTDILCNGGNDGSATVTASGGTAPFTYLWSDMQVSDTAIALTAGKYFVTVTDNVGATAIDSIIIAEPNPFNIGSIVTNTTTSASADGSIALTVTGGTTPYTFTWSAGISNTSTITGLAAGTYCATITDANGCDTVLCETVLSPTTLASLVISEINYNGPESGTDTSEYIEFVNIGTTTVNLSGYSFVEGVIHNFGQDDSITAGQYFVIAVDSSAFRNRYGVNANAIWTSGGLSNGGEDITIVDNFGRTVDSVDFDDNSPWPSGVLAGQPDGGGASIELVDSSLNNNDGVNWIASPNVIVGQIVNGFQVYGTPGTGPILVGVSENDLIENNLSIYPNPSRGMFTIETTVEMKNTRFQIVSIDGKILRDEIMNQSKINVDMSDYSNGVYFLRIGNTNKKLILTK